MGELTGIWQANLHEMIAELGEEKTSKLLSGFLCPNNPDVESFLRDKVILFAKQGFATTYLVFMSYKGQTVLVGYYALAIKAVVIKGTSINSKWRARLRRYADYDEALKQFTIALPLIGQLGKNFSNNYNELITGDELLQLACDKVRSLQMMASGKMVYLECEDIHPLTSFYERNGFYRFANRNLDGDERDTSKTDYLVQMLKYFSNKDSI